MACAANCSSPPGAAGHAVVSSTVREGLPAPSPRQARVAALGGGEQRASIPPELPRCADVGNCGRYDVSCTIEVPGSHRSVGQASYQSTNGITPSDCGIKHLELSNSRHPFSWFSQSGWRVLKNSAIASSSRRSTSACMKSVTHRARYRA